MYIYNEINCNVDYVKKNSIAAIEGQTERSVADTKRRLEMITWSNRLREHITHFISIPLNLPSLKEKLATFHKEVMDKCSEVKLMLYLKFSL